MYTIKSSFPHLFTFLIYSSPFLFLLLFYNHIIIPKGIQGAKALMAIPMAVGDRVRVTSVGCNIDIKGDEDIHTLTSLYYAVSI